MATPVAWEGRKEGRKEEAYNGRRMEWICCSSDGWLRPTECRTQKTVEEINYKTDFAQPD